MILKGIFWTPFSLQLQCFSTSKNKWVFIQFSSPSYSGIHETDTIHLFILRIKQMKPFSSDVVETWCYFHFHLWVHCLLCSKRHLELTLQISPQCNSILCTNSEFIHPLPLLLTPIYAYNTSVAHPCWSQYSNRTFFSDNAALCLGDKKEREHYWEMVYL